VNANLIFNWGRDPRFCSAVDIAPVDQKFLAVEVLQNTPPIEPEQVCSERLGRVKIVLANGHHLEVVGDYDLDSIVRLARGLAT
jgi:hypothetical protein